MPSYMMARPGYSFPAEQLAQVQLPSTGLSWVDKLLNALKQPQLPGPGFGTMTGPGMGSAKSLLELLGIMGQAGGGSYQPVSAAVRAAAPIKMFRYPHAELPSPLARAIEGSGKAAPSDMNILGLMYRPQEAASPGLGQHYMNLINRILREKPTGASLYEPMLNEQVWGSLP